MTPRELDRDLLCVSLAHRLQQVERLLRAEGLEEPTIQAITMSDWSLLARIREQAEMKVLEEK